MKVVQAQNLLNVLYEVAPTAQHGQGIALAARAIGFQMDRGRFCTHCLHPADHLDEQFARRALAALSVLLAGGQWAGVSLVSLALTGQALKVTEVICINVDASSVADVFGTGQIRS